MQLCQSIMYALTRASSRILTTPARSVRCMTSQTQARGRKEGDISSVFPSLSGVAIEPLPRRFAEIKRNLMRGNEERIAASWQRLLEQLEVENVMIKENGPNIIPQIQFSDLGNVSEGFLKEAKKRGVAVIKGVIPETEARNYVQEVQDYIESNLSTKGFPADNPQVYELYWSAPQVAARAHPNMLLSQSFLMNLWHSKDKDALISSQPLAYADRIRIRQPGDKSFALGPHIDGGSVERWEPTGYGLGNVYGRIFEGRWEEYDPWESSCRIPAVTDLYEGPGAASMFRMFQGWLGLSHTCPGEGTLMVKPLIQLSTAYLLLRPFFEPITSLIGTPEYLKPSSWRLKTDSNMDSTLHGALPAHCQELNDSLHPHLNLKETMVHVPKIAPGDFVAWHCDAIHAVDKTHIGDGDSSVLYIPACPTTIANARYLARQRDNFLSGYPGPDFPGGQGESQHVGRPNAGFLSEKGGKDGLRAMGLEKLLNREANVGANEVIRRSNEILGFA